MAKVKDMTVGNPMKILLTFALPMMAGNIFQQMYTTVDTMILGKFLGVEALASVGASDSFNWLTFGTVWGLAQGFSIKMAQDFGAKDYASLRKCVGNSILMALILAFTVGTLGFISTDKVLQFLNTPDDIRAGGVSYLRTLFIGMPIVMMYNLFASILRALGDAKTPLYAMIATSMINIGLDLLFVMGFKWGIVGAAAATVISWVCGTIFCLLVIRRIDILALSKEDFVLDLKLCGRQMGLGLPVAFSNTVIACGTLVVQFIINGFGVAFIAGIAAGNKLYGLLEVAASSYGNAMLTYMGQNKGALNYKRLKSGMRSALGLAVCTSLIISVCIIVFGRFILSGFISAESPALYDETMKIAYRYLFLMACALPILYILYVYRCALQGLGNTIIPLVSGGAELAARCLTAIFLPILFNPMALLWDEPSAWLAADLVLIPGYYIILRKVKREMEAKKAENA